jgi:hypothetical protein
MCLMAPVPASPLRGLQCCHVSHGSGPRLHAWEAFGTITCTTAPDPVFLLGRAPVLPRVPWLHIPPPHWEGLRCCHISHSSGPRLPTWEGFGDVMCHMALCGPCALRIKKDIADLTEQLDSHVFEARSHLPKVHVLDKCCSSHYGLQDVRACGTVRASNMCRQTTIVDR